ncbi:hypothetical protein CFP56_009267 [Quercus suber]
METQPE